AEFVERLYKELHMLYGANFHAHLGALTAHHPQSDLVIWQVLYLEFGASVVATVVSLVGRVALWNLDDENYSIRKAGQLNAENVHPREVRTYVPLNELLEAVPPDFCRDSIDGGGLPWP